MNTETSTLSTSEADDDTLMAYRAVSKAAVFSICFSILSITALFPEFWLLLLLPIGGVISGFLAIRNVRRYPEELTGARAGLIGVVASSVLFVAGLISNVVDYYTEVPDGFERVSFYQLQPDTTKPQQLVSDLAVELNGKKVFIKGYPHSGVSGSGPVKNFLLVPDMKQCCFGGQPKLMDMIEVNLLGDKTISWSPRKFELAGVLKVDPRPKPNDGSQGGYFQLEAEYVK